MARGQARTPRQQKQMHNPSSSRVELPPAALTCFNSPAEAFFTVFRDGTREVPFAALAADDLALARVATAFRAAARQVEAWCREHLGWTYEAGANLAHAFALTAGGWLLTESGDMDVLERDLGLAWRAFAESHPH
jgi:hypothetical protein